MDTGIDVGVLGPLQLRVDGVAVSPGTPKQRAVLATLILSRNRAVSTESLIAVAWEERPPLEAKAAMYTYVANLRRLLGRAGGRQHSVLSSAPPGYRLDIADTDCDLRAVKCREGSTGVHTAAAGRFGDACTALLYEGVGSNKRRPVLQDLSAFAFVAPFAAAMDEEKLLVHEGGGRRPRSLAGAGRAVIGGLEALVGGEHPYREPVWAQLITAYYVAAAGRPMRLAPTAGEGHPRRRVRYRSQC